MGNIKPIFSELPEATSSNLKNINASVLQVYHLIPFAAVNIEEIELTLETICGRGIYVKTSIHFMHTVSINLHLTTFFSLISLCIEIHMDGRESFLPFFFLFFFFCFSFCFCFLVFLFWLMRSKTVSSFFFWGGHF